MLPFASLCLLLMAMGSVNASFRMPFLEGLQPHTRVTVHLFIPHKAASVSIDFQKDDLNLYFRFEPRFGYGRYHTMCTTMKNSNWALPQFIRSIPFPFALGQRHKIDFDCENDFFKVLVNDKHYITYDRHLKPLQDIKLFEVVGANVDKASYCPIP
ncbi:galectin-3-like [Ambystoma mexicanum]|uniref:galectin-3-like n=1 Tax=Ambystoma mexicanum TaxID=8296 RepID=UPI0037E9BAD5